LVRYSISWQNPAERLYDITLSFRAAEDQPRLLLPVWRPGRYLIQNYAANVREWSAGERRVWKEEKSAWRVDAAAGENVTVSYRYYAGILDAGSSFLDEDEAYFNGSNLFMMVEAQRSEEALLTVAAPAHWRIETQLARDDANTFRARDYDHLIDSPVVAAANFTRHTFRESGAVIHLVFIGDEGIDTAQFVDPMRAIVASQAKMFGGLPVGEYRFLVHVGDRWHGVEHEASCSIIAKRPALLAAGKGDEGYEHFLSLASHEFFHVWNVKRILPAGFAPYDLSRETLTRLLWVMEGVTSYYGDLTLVRSGIWDEARYLKHLASEIETLESSPGRRVLSLEQASFDAWLQGETHDRANAMISFYNKGEVIAALLDLTIRRTGQGSLDDVMRKMASMPPLAEGDFRAAVESIVEVGDFFERYVEGTDPLPYVDVFAHAGIEVRTQPRAEASLGATFRLDNGKLLVASVLRGGAGMDAGLLPGDELVAINGTRTSSEGDVNLMMRTAQPAELLVARGGVIRQMTAAAKADPRVRVTLVPHEESPLRRAWLSQ